MPEENELKHDLESFLANNGILNPYKERDNR